jgi:deoxycytidylate deaminase
MSVAEVVAKKSKDPSTKVGCVIVTEDYEPVSFGCNNFIAGCRKEFMTFEKPQKYMLMVHAEMNSLIAAKRSIRGCRVYVTHAPCPNCLRNLLQAGVKEIVYDNFDTRGNIMDSSSRDALGRLLGSMDIIFRNIHGRKDI